MFIKNFEKISNLFEKNEFHKMITRKTHRNYHKSIKTKFELSERGDILENKIIGVSLPKLKKQIIFSPKKGDFMKKTKKGLLADDVGGICRNCSC